LGSDGRDVIWEFCRVIVQDREHSIQEEEGKHRISLPSLSIMACRDSDEAVEYLKRMVNDAS